jgi:hypothetical protein
LLKSFFVGILKVNDENRRIRIRIRIHTNMSWIRNTGLFQFSYNVQIWGGTRVTVRTVERREEEELLVQELEALTHLKHPNILLLMGRLKEPLLSK